MAVEDEKGGVLILIAGPSGAGKDTLITAARRAFGDHPDFVFPLRIITRSDQSGEEHIYLEPREFEQLRDGGRLFLEWEAHGLYYGISAAIEQDLAVGRTVIFNISRQLIPAARAKWARTEVIFIRVAPELLRDRLRNRGRETEEQIEARLRRGTLEAFQISEPVHIFDNSASLETTIPRFLTLLTVLRAMSCPEARRAENPDISGSLGLPL